MLGAFQMMHTTGSDNKTKTYVLTVIVFYGKVAVIGTELVVYVLVLTVIGPF